MEILERAFKVIPGLTLVFAIVALLMLKAHLELAAAIRAFAVAWALYWTSKSLDWLFDLAYGPRPDRAPKYWTKVLLTRRQVWWGLRMVLLPGYWYLEGKRKAAVSGLKLGQVKGLHDKAKAILEKEGRWETEVKPWVSYSKAARAFILPFFLITLLMSIPEVQRQPQQWSPAFISRLGEAPLVIAFSDDFKQVKENFKFLENRRTPALLCLTCLLLYLALRIKHMGKLYKLVTPATPGKIDQPHSLRQAT